MKTGQAIKYLAYAELAFMASLVYGFATFSPTFLSEYRVYEIFGVLLAALITTIGIYGMREST